MRNLSYGNEFCMQFHFNANQSLFYNNGFALRLPLKQGHMETRKWPILCKVRDKQIHRFKDKSKCLLKEQCNMSLLANLLQGIPNKICQFQTFQGILIVKELFDMSGHFYEWKNVMQFELHVTMKWHMYLLIFYITQIARL